MQAELDRWCAAMISIRKEIAEIEDGKADRYNFPAITTSFLHVASGHLSALL